MQIMFMKRICHQNLLQMSVLSLYHTGVELCKSKKKVYHLKIFPVSPS